MKYLLMLTAVYTVVSFSVITALAQAKPDYSNCISSEVAFFEATDAGYDSYVYEGVTMSTIPFEEEYECAASHFEVDTSITHAWPLQVNIDDPGGSEPNRYTQDAHSLSRGEPQRDNIFTVSNYAPPVIGKSGHTYYKLPNEFRWELMWCITEVYSSKIPIHDGRSSIFAYNFSEETNGYDNASVLFEWFTLRGADSSGIYYAYYDTYYPPREVGGQPFLVYDRIYLSELAALNEYADRKFQMCDGHNLGCF